MYLCFLYVVLTESCDSRSNANITTRIVPSQCVTINDCVFWFCTCNDHGGAISIKTGESNSVVSGTIFYSCSCGSYNGGAIYKYAGYQFDLNRVCFSQCSAGSGSSFYIDMYYWSFNICKVNLTSVNLCSKSLISSQKHSSRAICANYSVQNFNSSNNFIYEDVSGIGFKRVENARLDFCSFSNNVGNSVISFEMRSKNLITYCNFISNSKSTLENGVITSDESFVVKNSMFKSNSNIICKGTMTFESCSVDNMTFSGSIATLYLQNNPTMISHNRFSTQFCSASIYYFETIFIQKKALISYVLFSIINTCLY